MTTIITESRLKLVTGGMNPAVAARPRVRREPGLGFALSKRTLDLFGGAVGLVMTAPLLAACCAWVWLLDRGPVIYRQWRVGRDGRLFRIYKLRTMSLNAERGVGARFAESEDPRILRGCSWMRRSHVDELPQLWNIVLGHMSLVGPRPERPEIIEWLRQHLPGVEERLSARPGLTGLAQVCNGYTYDIAGARRKLAFDLKYLRQRSVINDLRLLVRTLPKIWDHAAH